MTRTTRAALRSNQLAEEAANAAIVPLPTTPQRERLPLGEISDNRGAEPSTVAITYNEPVKQHTKPRKEGKVGKKGKKHDKENEPHLDIMVLEDGDQSSVSSAAEEARKALAHMDLADDQAVKADESAQQVTSSPAADAASKDVLPQMPMNTQSPHKSKSDGEDIDSGVQDSSSGLKTPEAASQTLDSIIEGGGVMSEKPEDDSFVDQIRSRSPAKRISRIEDSVEALDRLEDEIEKASAAIPLSEATGSKEPIKKEVQAKPGTGNVAKQAKAAKSKDLTRPTRDSLELACRSVAAATTPSVRGKSNGRNVVAPRNQATAIGKNPSPPKALPSLPDAPQVGHKGTKPRLSSLNKAPFQPTKSAKPTTVASFELPGEAIARKLKERREERAKRESEVASKPKAFKARPVKSSQPPDVKMTATTKARLSMARNISGNQQHDSSPTKTLAKTPSEKLRRGESESKRVSSISLPKRGSDASKLQAGKTVGKRVSSINSGARFSLNNTDASRTAPKGEDLAQQKERGKAVFARPKNALAERERAKKEKEVAAAKARMEAAERGRIASRQWAERQKQKDAARKTSGSPKAVAA